MNDIRHKCKAISPFDPWLVGLENIARKYIQYVHMVFQEANPDSRQIRQESCNLKESLFLPLSSETLTFYQKKAALMRRVHECMSA